MIAEPYIEISPEELEKLGYDLRTLEFAFRKYGGFKKYVLECITPNKHFECIIYAVDVAGGKGKVLYRREYGNWKELQDEIQTFVFEELAEELSPAYLENHYLVAELWRITPYTRKISSYIYYFNNKHYYSSGGGSRHSFDQVKHRINKEIAEERRRENKEKRMLGNRRKIGELRRKAPSFTSGRWKIVSNESFPAGIVSFNKTIGQLDFSGVYAFCGIGKDGNYKVFYIGRCRSFAARLPGHEKFGEIKKEEGCYGDDLIIKYRPNSKKRFEEYMVEKAFRDKLQPPFNGEYRQERRYLE